VHDEYCAAKKSHAQNQVRLTKAKQATISTKLRFKCSKQISQAKKFSEISAKSG
jgi:hypothetical protein